MHRTDDRVKAVLHHADDELDAEKRLVQGMGNLHNQIEDGLAHVD